MNVEEGLFLHRVEFAVEFVVILVLELGRSLGPERLEVVDDLVLVGIDVFAVFPLLLLAENDGDGHKLAVLVEEALDAGFLREFGAVIVQIEGDDRAAFLLVAETHFVFRRAVAAPLHRLGTFLPGKGVDRDLL